MLTSRMVEAFRAVILQGSISGAAGFLNVSQPAVSRLIQDLEREIGYRLFERRRGRVFANEEALDLYEEVHRSFVGLDRIAQTAEQIGKREAGTLRIACLPAVGLSVMPKAVVQFRRRYPGIRISLQISRSTTVIQFLNAMQCDIGFVESAHILPSLEAGPAFELETKCVVAHDHRLAAREFVEPGDLADEAFISLDPDSQTRLRIDAVFDAANVSRQLITEVPLTNAACLLVLEGCGVSIVDPMTANLFAPLGLVAIPFRPAALFTFQALSTTRMRSSDLLADFYQEFSETLPSAS